MLARAPTMLRSTLRAAAIPSTAVRATRASSTATKTGAQFNSTDDFFQAHRLPASHGEEKRAYTYFVLGGARFMYASAVRLAVIGAVSSLSASADVMALASVEVDLSNINLGQTVTVKWRGKPVFIKHRTAEQIAECEKPVTDLRHPQTDQERVKKPEWLLLTAICTHLGCVPIPNAGDYGGYYCPCHGSHYDGSGRIRRGPAPLNLEVPPYSFITDTKVVIG